jgi:hypothetical protein
MLPVGVLAAALIALLAFAPFASAASDPLASGKTTMTLQKSFTNYLKTFGITVSKISPAKLSGGKATFNVTGGSLDPTNGKGTVNLGGGLKFKAGKANAQVKGLVLDTNKKTLTGKISGKKVKIATITSTSTRSGFGVNLKINKVKLTNAGATQLNKKLGFSKGKPKPFLKNKLIAKATAETQPATVTVLPVGDMTFSGSPVLLTKLKNVEVSLQTLGLTKQTGSVFTAPILGGTVSPTGTAGQVESGIGIKMVQNLPLPTAPGAAITTNITLGGMYVDLAGKTATVEVIAESNAESPAGSGKKPLNLGNLGRSSIADIVVTGVNADPTTRTVAINAAGVLQAISAEVLQGFVSVYQAYVEGGAQIKFCENPLAAPEACKNQPEKEAAAKFGKEKGDEVAKNKISAGEALGTFSFTAQTQ